MLSPATTLCRPRQQQHRPVPKNQSGVRYTFPLLNTVVPFVVVSVLGTTRCTPADPDCLARRSACEQSPALGFLFTAVYSEHTPPLRRLKHLTDIGQAPGTTPAAIVVPALGMSVIVRVSWLRGCWSPGHPAVCPLAKAAQFPCASVHARFQGPECRSCPLPTSRWFVAVSGFRSESHCTFRHRLSDN